jgi:uncharacterized membrane protein HdeD (DUF308 family)
MLSKIRQFMTILGIIMLVLGTVATILPIFSMMIVAIAEENMTSLIDFLPKTLDINQNFVGIVLIIAGFFFLLIGKVPGEKHSDK